MKLPIRDSRRELINQYNANPQKYDPYLSRRMNARNMLILKDYWSDFERSSAVFAQKYNLSDGRISQLNLMGTSTVMAVNSGEPPSAARGGMITKNIFNRIKELSNMGHTATTIAIMLGIGVTTVQIVLRNETLSDYLLERTKNNAKYSQNSGGKRSRITEEHFLRVKELMFTGMNDTEIAREVGSKNTTIKRIRLSKTFDEYREGITAEQQVTLPPEPEKIPVTDSFQEHLTPALTEIIRGLRAFVQEETKRLREENAVLKQKLETYEKARKAFLSGLPEEESLV